MPFQMALVVAIVLALVLVAFLVVVTWNSVVALGRRCDRAWANVDVALQQRWDELPNVVAAVRGVMGFEQRLLEDLTRLRAAYAPHVASREQAVVATRTSLVLRSLFGVVEEYPDLRSAGNVLALQEEIERLEDVIARRRELYNDQVFRYNTAIEQLPGALLRPLAGWRPRESFAADASAQTRPDVALG